MKTHILKKLNDSLLSSRGLTLSPRGLTTGSSLDPAAKPRDDIQPWDDRLEIFFHSHKVEDFFEKMDSFQNESKFIYFARYGKAFDGHKFALKIIHSKNFLVGEKSRILNNFPITEEQNKILSSKYFILVDNVEMSLKDTFKKIAESENFNFTSIGVTGTSGKTSVVQLTGQILKNLLKKKTLKIGTFGIEIGDTTLSNSHVTTPDYPTFINALQLAKKENIDSLIMEVSSHGLAESRLHDYKFDICVFTNFSQDHLDFHTSMSEYLCAKTLLFSNHLKTNGTCIVSARSREWIHIVQKSLGKKTTLFLLIDENQKEVCNAVKKFENRFKELYFLKIDQKKSTLNHLSGFFTLFDKNQKTLIREYFSTPLIGEANFENLMIIFCICRSLGYPSKEFMPYFANLKGIPGRMQKIPGPDDKPCVIVDYAHKPDALEFILKTLRKLLTPRGPANWIPRSSRGMTKASRGMTNSSRGMTTSNKLITVFGCGGDRDASKRPLMGNIAALLSDIVIVTSDNPRTEDPEKIIHQIIAGMPNPNHPIVEVDRRLAIQRAFKIAQKSDIILIAGRGNETHQIIGTQKYNFSDIELAETFLNQR